MLNGRPMIDNGYNDNEPNDDSYNVNGYNDHYPPTGPACMCACVCVCVCMCA